MKPIRGFTLLELMVAIGIFALVSAIAYGSLTRLLADRERLESEHEFWRTLSLTFTRLEDDLSQVRNRQVKNVIGSKLPAFQGQPTDTRMTAAPSVEFTRGGVITFDSGPRSDLQRIGYRLVDGTLKRIVWPVLDQAPQSVPQEVPMLKNVQEFRVRFLYSSAGSAGVWLDQWPGAGTDDPPTGIEVKLTLTGRGEFTRLFLVNG